MELVVVLVVVVVVALIYYNRSARSLDVNQDGLVDIEDAKVAVSTAMEGVKDDAKQAAVKTKTAASSAAKKVTAKPSTKKPAARKSSARKSKSQS